MFKCLKAPPKYTYYSAICNHISSSQTSDTFLRPHFIISFINSKLRFSLGNSINTYLRLKIRVVCG